jgi:MraZ protein
VLHRLNLDAKGRLSVPTRHRDALGASQRQPTHHHQTSPWLPDGIFPRSANGNISVTRVCGSADVRTVVEAYFPGQCNGRRHGQERGAYWSRPNCARAACITRDVMLLGMGSYHLELWDARPPTRRKNPKAMQGEMPDVFKDFSF